MICLAESHDCAANLAGEELLIGGTGHILYLWENAPCVVIGRYQNPYRECDLERMEKDHVLLVRRHSGGGAVYHDRGNICFTFIADRDSFSKEENFLVIQDALLSLHIPSVLSGRNDILVDGKKISGNAFQYTKDRFCHHGTLLVSSDLSAMGNYLTPSKEKMEDHAVASVRRRVGNLQATVSTITNDLVKDAFIQAFEKRYGKQEIVKRDFLHDEATRERRDEFGKQETILEKTPPFSWSIGKRFSWGEVHVALAMGKGIITDAFIDTDCLNTGLVPVWRESLRGLPFRKSSFIPIQEGNETRELWAFLRDHVPT